MDAQTRRQEIARRLEREKNPISATALAREFSVSRQVVVGDVALLRATGLDIAATPRGYVLPSRPEGKTFTVACIHSAQDMEQELNAVVDQGCTVLDVIVEHPVYGQLTGPLDIATRHDVQVFMNKVQSSDAAPLSDLTGGIHLHTVFCPDRSAYERIIQALREEGFLYEDKD